MRTTIFTLLFICYSVVSFSQEEERMRVIDADTTWFKEIIPFPIHFAPEIKFEGYEDAQFPTGWAKQESPEFWSYIFAWNINHTTPLSPEELEINLQFYFDGLMKLINKDKELVLPPTTAVFMKADVLNSGSDYAGKVKFFDAFHTKKIIHLNVLVNYHFCQEQKKSIIVFRFSPQKFDATIWDILKAVSLRVNACKL